MHKPPHADPASCREQALAAWQRGELGVAEQAFRQWLESTPDDVQALQFVAERELERGNIQRSIELLMKAQRAQPQDAAVLHRLGELQMLAGNPQAAIASLRHGLQLAPAMFVARLRLGVVLEQQGHDHDAMLAYIGAIDTAQTQGRWLSDATTAAGLRDAVKHATRFVASGRRALFDAIIAPLRQRYGPAELARVDECLAIYLGEHAANLPDPRQRPKFLYFPGIPSRTFYPRERFPAHARLEAAFEVMREELGDVLAHGPGQLTPFLGAPASEAVAAGMLAASGTAEAAWDAFFFYRHGVRHDAQCRRCPRTSELLDTMPLVRVREHAPEALFSVLRPGTHILPHRGVTNTRLVTHLPLIVPPDCALRVGGETHVWQAGRCVTFDDTFEHEAWNRSDRDRVVLILDSWNPDLSEVEQAAVADLVAAIGEFNHASKITPTNASVQSS